MLAHLNLNDVIDRLDPAGTKAGRRAETLVKTDQLRLVLVTMAAGALLDEHTAPGPIAIQGLRGRLRVLVGDEPRDLPPGEVIALAPETPHTVHAPENGAFLLTIGWAGEARVAVDELHGG
ncbi:MAG: cupin domain-containing protein [Thermomicrobiales bacterium]|nr:cupin domain-containing protein [Thermomicrobiales bacterium]